MLKWPLFPISWHTHRRPSRLDALESVPSPSHSHSICALTTQSCAPSCIWPYWPSCLLQHWHKSCPRKLASTIPGKSRHAFTIHRIETLTEIQSSPDKSCELGCCGGSGYCGFGPTFCGLGNCTSGCDRKSECDPGWGSQWSNATDCPLNVCCSQFGFCGTTYGMLASWCC